MKMQNIEQMPAEELREIIYRFYSILLDGVDEDVTLNVDNCLSVLIDSLTMADTDHDAAKMAILFYNELMVQLGNNAKAMTVTIESLQARLP